MQFIELTKGKMAIVDDDDFQFVSQYKWCTAYSNKKIAYPKAWIDGKPILMHTFLMNTPKGYEVDHINGDGLDNRRLNLRVCKPSKNKMNKRKSKTNKSGYKGVSLCTTGKSWRVDICANGKNNFLGRYEDKEIAGIIYDMWAKFYHDEFAKINFPDTEHLKKWANKYQYCLVCRDTKYPHVGYGYCDKCYRLTPAYKHQNKKWFQKYYSKHKEERKEKMKDQSTARRRAKNHTFFNFGQFGI